MDNSINLVEEFTQEDLRLIRGCLLTTKETFKIMPFKSNDIKYKITQINDLLKKFREGS